MPRKTQPPRPRHPRGPLASMRPRPDAAENRASVSNPPATRDASMRPRPDAAENRWRCWDRRWRPRRFNEAAARCRGKPRRNTDAESRPHRASMRPRPDAAENPTAGATLREHAQVASMRPRPDAAENLAGARSPGARRIGFNEAAARCRGKPRPRAGTVQPHDGASMRPRPDAAENRRRPASLPPCCRRASMRPRPDAAENPWLSSRCGSGRSGFNEAAARCRGKPRSPT